MGTLFANQAARPSLAQRLEQAEITLDAAFEAHRCSALFACFSGGHDSLVAAELASRHERFAGCLHVNTGIGVEATRRFVRETCAARGWPLYELHPPGEQYEDLVLRHGFPGPAAHLFMYSWLKERALRRFCTVQKTDHRDHLALATGVRRAESRRRMGIARAIQQEDARVWAAPILEWDSLDKEAFMRQERLPRNPVVEALGMSGECLCGAFAKPGEFDRIAAVCPATADRIQALEARAAAAGVHCSWEDRPPREAKPADPAQMTFAPVLCAGCEWRQ